MMSLPFCAYLLTDKISLLEYERKGNETTPSDIVRHLFALKRGQDKLKPDYCLTFDYEREKKELGFNKDEPLRFYLVRVLKYLARRYLFFSCGQLYVKEEMLDEWMEFVKIFPPLMVEVAFFVDDCQFKDNDCKFFNEYLVPIFENSAIRRPYNRNLEKYVIEEGGLSDLHIHMNGTSETDMVWWSQIGNVEKWIGDFFPSWEKEDVKRQHEQLFDTSIKEAKVRVRKAKALLREIVAEMCQLSEGNILFPSLRELLHNNSDSCPILAKGAYFYWKLFTLMQDKCCSDNIAHEFHELSLILGYVHQMMVQQYLQKGFSQFQLITSNDLRSLHEEKNYYERFMQLGLDCKLNIIKYIEVRFSPSVRLSDNIAKVSHVAKGFEMFKAHLKHDECEKPVLRLIAHFIKRENKRYSGYCRHCALRKEVMQKARSLWKLNKYLVAKSRSPIVGIDAAANEMHAGPEVFSPAFRLLRGLMQKEKLDLHFTYHAGEDFRHLLSGLRSMVEAVDFLEMKQGDRLGHCTAAGINPELWVDRMGGVVKLTKGEWLDDLLMVYDLILNNNFYPGLTKLISRLHAEIEDIHMEIYEDNSSVADMVKAWKYRMYDPDIYLRHKRNYYLPYLSECSSEIQNKRKFSKAEDLYRKYHYDEGVKMRYSTMKEINLIDSFITATNLMHIQNLVLHKVAKKKIAIEVLFSSNLAISFYLCSSEHHLERWISGDTEGKLIMPPLVLGSDDPGIFMTNIYIEYSRVMNYLESHGHSFKECMKILNEFAQTSKLYSFES